MSEPGHSWVHPYTHQARSCAGPRGSRGTLLLHSPTPDWELLLTLWVAGHQDLGVQEAPSPSQHVTLQAASAQAH